MQTIYLGNDDDLWAQLPAPPEDRPLDVLVVGLPGSGKTTLAKRLVGEAIVEGITFRDMMLTSHTVTATNRLARQVGLHLLADDRVRGAMDESSYWAVNKLLGEVGRTDTSDAMARPSSPHIGTTIAVKRRNMEGVKTIDQSARMEVAYSLCGIIREVMGGSDDLDEDSVAVGLEKFMRDHEEGMYQAAFSKKDLRDSAEEVALKLVTSSLALAQRARLFGRHIADQYHDERMAFERRKLRVPQTRDILIPLFREIEMIDAAYQKKMEEMEVADFHSILMAATPALEIKFAIFDEAQDYNRLILDNAKDLSAKARHRFWLGDHNQALYGRWAGGDAHMFKEMQKEMDVVVYLTQCNRIGMPAFMAMKPFYHMINGNEDFVFQPRLDRKTDIVTRRGMDAIRAEDISGSTDPVDDVMVLLRADPTKGGHYAWQRWFDARGMLYHMSGTTGLSCFYHRERQHILSLWTLLSPGVNGDGEPYERGLGAVRVKSLFKRLGIEMPKEKAPYYIKSDLPELPALDTVEWIPQHWKFMERALKTYGTLDPKELRALPGAVARIGTVHGAKGEEAAHVIVDCRYRRSKCYEPFEKDEEKCIWLVAVTRARRTLIILEGEQTRQDLPRTEDDF